MEDNEFEEVTIISHTDHGTSVLPQSTAERLMKEIKLEVTQKISQNENQKLGSLQNSTTPTLLDSIYQNVFRLETQTRYIRHVSHHPWNSVEKRLLFGFDQRVYAVDHTGSQVTKISEFPARIETVSCWGDYIFVFRIHNPPEVVNWSGKLIRRLDQSLLGSRRPHTSSNWLYYQGEEKQIIRVSKSLESSLVSFPEESNSIHDISVREVKNAELILLLEDGTLIFGNKSSQLPHSMEYGWFSPLKQMYSDHFLVSFQDIDEDISTLHLVDLHTLASISTVTVRQFEIRQIQLFKPTLQIHPIVLTGLNRVQVAAVFNRTLHLLAKYEFPDVCVYCMVPLSRSEWLFGLGTGFLPKLSTIHFDFPSPLKL